MSPHKARRRSGYKNGEARRAIANNGGRGEHQRISSDKHVIGVKNIPADGAIKLSLGRKRHVLLKAE